MALSVELRDDNGRWHRRKNLWLLQLIELKQQCRSTTGAEQNRLQQDLKNHRRKKSSHPYMVELEAYYQAERRFKHQSSKQASGQANAVADKIVLRWGNEFEMAQRERLFYEPYCDLCYDAQLAFESAVAKEIAYRDMIEGCIELLRKRDELATSNVDSAKAELVSVKYQLKSTRKARQRVLESNLSDLRRNTPVEGRQVSPALMAVTFPLPGLGQLFNGQIVKACLYFIGLLYVYLVAIPYALGYGNYRGKGIFGLISLASKGTRLDRSVIFLIEGVIAITLLVFALVVIVSACLDSLQTRRRCNSGVRPNQWFETKLRSSHSAFPLFVTLPTLVMVTFVVLVPIATTFLISFTNYDPDHQAKFAWNGLSNYLQIFAGQGIAGGPFWRIMGWTIIWTLGASTLAILLGFFLSIVCHQERLKGKTVFRTIFLLPWAVPAFITIMFFSVMLSTTGPITQLFQQITGATLRFKDDPVLTRFTLIALQGWLGSSYIFLLSTGVLQGIPKDLYEAAEIDGASVWQRLRKITVPLVLFQTAPLLLMQYTFNFNNFSLIFLFNGGGPFNPTLYGNLAGTTDILISYIYKLTINKQFQAIGSAITILVSLFLMMITWFGFRNSKAFSEEES